MSLARSEDVERDEADPTFPEDPRIPGRLRWLLVLSLLIAPFATPPNASLLLARSGLFPGRARLWAELAALVLVMLAVVLLTAAWVDRGVREIRWQAALGQWARRQSDETLVRTQDRELDWFSRLVLRNESKHRHAAPSSPPSGS